MAERKSEHTGSTRTSAPEDVVPILKSDEVGVTNRVLGSGGFCTVSPVRWIKVVNPQESTTSTATSASTSPINTPPTPPTPPSDTKANGQQHARTTLAKQFKDYEEKHHSSKNIVVPGYTTTPQPMDPFAQKPPRVALKRIKPSLRKERYHVGVNDLVAEASVLAKCSHPNIISLYAVGSCDDDADADAEQQDRGGDNNNNASSPSPVPSRISFVIIDQLRSTLRNKLYKWKDDKGITPSFMKSKKALDDLWLERMVVIIKVADAIRYLHSKGIVHRDINPDNIGFADDNVVKLFDFGLAKSIGRDGKNCDATSDGGVDGDDNEIFDLTSLTGTIR
jgi:serine/threonine protein kinase